MALRTTSKVRLYMHSSVQSEVLSFLQEKEVFELIEQKDAKKGGEAEYALANLDFAIRFLSKYAPAKKGIRAKFLGEKIEISELEARKIASQCDWKGCVKKIQKLEGEKNDLTRSIADSSSEVELLSGWEGTKKTDFGKFSTGFFRISEKDFDEFTGRVEALTKHIDVSLVSQKQNQGYYCVIAQATELAEVRAITQSIKGVEVLLPTDDIEGKISSLKGDIRAMESKLEDNELKIISCIPELEGLKITYDCFSSKEGVEKSLNSSIGDIDSVSVVEGWIITDSLESTEKQMNEKFSGVAIEIVEQEDGDIPPVHLESSKATSPFSVVTKIYGAPGPNEIDPTPFLMPFFIVFFGLCLTDAGYGALLAGTMGWILFAKMPISAEMKDMIRLLFYAGISTVIFGVIFGGYFGIAPTASFIPEALTYLDAEGNTKFLGQVFRPMEDLMTKIAPLIILLGIGHLLLGVGLKGYVALKNKKIWDFAMVSIPTFTTIFLGVLTLLASVTPGSTYEAFGIISPSLFEPLKMLTIASFVVMSVGIFKSGGAIAWFMDVTGWLSNTLSYARLFALGLATGIVASVFNMVAFTIGDMMPSGLDIIVIVFIILFGHTLNVALNLLGAFVHSGRLQFVEFFGQFLEGGGRFFSPLKKTRKYVYTENS